jgi:ribosome-binding protein aMBF1 (putative translation factor)
MNALIRATGLSNKAIARWLARDKSTIGRWASGTASPTRGEAMVMEMLATGELPERFRPEGTKP